jgi:uncharacterized protein with HEPN domain
MQHEDFKNKVEEKFKQNYWDVPWAEALAARCKVTCELFEAESEVKQRIRTEATEEHKEELERWKDTDGGLPSANEEDQIA